MTFNEYQELSKRTINKDLHNYEKELHSLHGMVGEIGEIHSIYQKTYQGHARDYEHIKSEIGDLLWFVAEFCTSMDFNMDDIAAANIEKLKARYPDGFDIEHSLHRAKGDI